MIRKIAIIIISRKGKTKHKLCIMLVTWGASSPKFTISLVLELFLMIIIVFVCAEEIIGESGWTDFKHAKWSSTKFLSMKERDSLDSYQTLHRKLGNVMVTQMNFDKGHEIDLLNCAKSKSKCRGPHFQKLHNVPSGPNPIGNFDSMGVRQP